ncbi:MAG TPA: ABC transporter permease [Gemmatimonadaceae bacterium]|nr:ABC transporter permease [Gemmatimonadaceae bacterium]
MSLRQSVIYACRSLARAPLFSIAVVLTLTIGIGAASAIFAVVNAVLLRPLPFEQPDRLIGVWFDMAPINLYHVQQTAGTYRTFKQFARSIEGIAAYQDGSLNVADPDNRGEPARVSVAWLTASAIPLLGVRPVAGRSFSEAEDQPKAAPVAVISERMWKRRFAGDASPLGKKLVVAGKLTEIIGVMPDRFRFPNASTDIWLPLQLDPHDPYPGGFNYNTFARLKPGYTLEAARRDFDSALPRAVEVSPNMAPGVSMQMVFEQAKPINRLVPMRDDVIGDAGRTLWMVAATALLVLLVTCANVANLLLVRADARQRELAVRSALGAGRGRVLAHFLTEAGVLAAVSAALGLATAAFATRLLVTAGPGAIPRLSEVEVNGTVVAFTLIVAALVAAACSAFPAVRFLRGNPLAGLRDGGRGGTAGGKRQRTRGALVVAQVALALVVLATSALLLRSFQRLHAVRPGFDPEGVATLWVAAPNLRYPTDSSVVRFFMNITDRVAQLPGVRGVGLASRLPLSNEGMNQNPVYAEGDVTTAKKIPPLAVYVTADSGYFRAMGIPLVAGRLFDRLDRQHPDEAIISVETARSVFHDSTGRSALNKRFQQLPNSPWHTVVGVVGSVRDTTLAGPPARAVYLPQAVGGDTTNGQLRRTMAIVARTSGDVGTATRGIQRIIRELDPTLPTFGVRSMRATVDASMAMLSFTMVVLIVAAAVTLVLGMIGLYGVIAYVVALRTRELGVRIALGAQPSAVATMVTSQGLALCGAGVAIGLVLVVLGGRFLRSLLFEVGPADPVALGTTVLIIVGFALVASWIPARRAARVNPAEALRTD